MTIKLQASNGPYRFDETEMHSTIFRNKQNGIQSHLNSLSRTYVDRD